MIQALKFLSLLLIASPAFAGLKNPPQQLCTVKSFAEKKATVNCDGELYEVDKTDLRPESKGPMMAHQRVFVWTATIQKAKASIKK